MMKNPNLNMRESVMLTACILAVPFLRPGFNFIVDMIQMFFGIADSDGRGAIVGMLMAALGVIVTLFFMNSIHQQQRKEIIRRDRLNEVRNSIISVIRNVTARMDVHNKGIGDKGMYIFECGENSVIIEYGIYTNTFHEENYYQFVIYFRLFSSAKDNVKEILKNRKKWWRGRIVISRFGNDYSDICEYCNLAHAPNICVDDSAQGMDGRNYNSLIVALSVIQNSVDEELMKYQKKLLECEIYWNYTGQH